MHQPHLTPELSLLEDQLRRFLVRDIASHYDQWERAGMMPREIWRSVPMTGRSSLPGKDVYNTATSPSRRPIPWRIR